MQESLSYKDIKDSQPTVYVIQDIPGTKIGAPKINIIGASSFGKLKDYKSKDYLLLTGDPAIIGVACSIVSDITNGKYKLLKWDKQERKYYPVEIDLYNKT